MLNRLNIYILVASPWQVLVNNLAGAGPDHTATGPLWPSAAKPELRWRAGRTVKGENLEVAPWRVKIQVSGDSGLQGGAP